MKYDIPQEKLFTHLRVNAEAFGRLIPNAIAVSARSNDDGETYEVTRSDRGERDLVVFEVRSNKVDGGWLVIRETLMRVTDVRVP